METIQIQCGSCGKLMGISSEHLGVQVRCPHCQAVVQAPPAAPPAPQLGPSADPPEIKAPAEVESIFAPPEPSEDLFDAAPQRPLIEMPSEVEPTAVAGATGATTLEAPTPPRLESTEVYPDAAVQAPPAEPDADLSALARPRPPVDRGYTALMLLIFLVPYSILMTVFVIYLWNQLANQAHPLDYLVDPAPKKDGAKQSSERPKHDQPLAAHQKVPLGKTVRIGEAEVRPTRVARDALGDLEITVHVKNLSARNEFSPLAPEFLKIVPGKTEPIYPYTFLDSRSQSFPRLYGGHLAFQRDDNLTDEGLLKPGQEEDVRITTRDNKPVVQKILESNEAMIWRVQLRRGVVDHREHKLSVTAVIGVVFNARDIERGG
jgi:hypothetical protein